MKKKPKNEKDDVEYEECPPEASSLSSSARTKKINLTLKTCIKERREYLMGWQRAKADLINERKASAEREVLAGNAAKEQFLFDLLPVLDSFDMAFTNKEVWEKVDANWRMGVEYIYAQLLSTIEQNGFVQYNPLGEFFDPALHQSIEMVTVSDSKKDSKILEVLQKGYKKGSAIIRPAKVKVGIYKKTKE